MAKKIKTKVKLQIVAGKANPAPPVGPALGQHGLNIMEFCNQFNEKTKEMGNSIIPVEITIYEDRTFEFITKQPPVADLILKTLNIEKGSGVPNKEKVGKLSKKQVIDIAQRKMQDLNAHDIDAASRIVAGTARSMGIETEK